LTGKAHVPNFLDIINELTREIARPGITADGLCQFLSFKTLSFLDPSAMYISKLHDDGMVRNISSCGINQEMQNSWKEVAFAESLPSNDAMRAEKMIWLADSTDWNNQYPDLAQYMLVENSNTFIAIPIDVPGSAVASIGIMSSKVHRQTKDLASFLWTVGGLVSLFFTNNKAELVEDYLSPRQLEILEFMRDSYTNPEIAKELGFSESTIRHETMRIYQILKVAGRKEAINTAISQNLIKNSGARIA
jgi:DNA-binding CsgD family transcriptional regulator